MLVNEVRDLVSVLKTAERRKEFEKKDMFMEAFEEAKPLFEKSIESWRDYLYKYALVLISILGFTTTLIATKWVGELNVYLIVIGISCLILSALMTFLSIFITLFLERQFVTANMEFTKAMAVDFHKADGKDDITRNPMRAIEMYYQDSIPKREKDLEMLKQSRKTEGLTAIQIQEIDWKIDDLTKGISHDRRAKSLMKYVGVQYNEYETARLIITLVIVAVSLVGLSTITFALLQGYYVTSKAVSVEAEMTIKSADSHSDVGASSE